MINARSSAVFVSSLLILCAGARGAESDYVIGVRDVVSLQVFEEPDLNVERKVGEDGTIRLPHLGEFPVSGMTEREAAASIKAQLEASYLQKATVSLEVTEFHSRPVSVLGAVRQPGTVYLEGGWTLFQVLTAAGGLSENNAGVAYVLRRASNGLTDQLELDLRRLLVEGDQTFNIPVLPDDVVNVPAAVDIHVSFLGEVARQGAVALPGNERATLLTAIALAGGLTDRASNKIVVKRTDSSGRVTELEANYKRVLNGKDPDLKLQDGDLIVVRESFL